MFFIGQFDHPTGSWTFLNEFLLHAPQGVSIAQCGCGGGNDGGAAFLRFGIMFPCLVCTEEFCFVLKKNSDVESLYSKSVNGMHPLILFANSSMSYFFPDIFTWVGM